MPELSAFQDAFTAALAGDEAAFAPWADGPAEAGLSVYRNTVAKGLVDALGANFPTVERLVGEAWFRAAAHEFARSHPPAAPALAAYGAGFPDWLAAFPPAEGLAYLPGVAGLDRLWTEAHLAPDAEPLDPAALANLGPETLAHVRAAPHPSARLAWSIDNTPSLWLANRPPAAAPEPFQLTDAAEGLLLVRPGAVVLTRRLDAAAFAFAAACRDGASLAAAAAAALEAEGDADLAAIVAAAFEDGFFTTLQPVGGDAP